MGLNIQCRNFVKKYGIRNLKLKIRYKLEVERRTNIKSIVIFPVRHSVRQLTYSESIKNKMLKQVQQDVTEVALFT